MELIVDTAQYKFLMNILFDITKKKSFYEDDGVKLKKCVSKVNKH